MKLSIKDLAYISLYLALFIVFDYLSNIISLFKMPYGGTLGIGVIVLLVASYHLGIKKGILITLASVLLQFITGRVIIVSPYQFVLDYLLAFSVYGIAKLFPRYQGIIISNLLRYIFHVLSGVIFFKEYAGSKNVIVYSLIYNAGYMIPTLILCWLVVPLIVKRIPQSGTQVPVPIS